jgi:hypothetical protein
MPWRQFSTTVMTMILRVVYCPLALSVLWNPPRIPRDSRTHTTPNVSPKYWRVHLQPWAAHSVSASRIFGLNTCSLVFVLFLHLLPLAVEPNMESPHNGQRQHHKVSRVGHDGCWLSLLALSSHGLFLPCCRKIVHISCSQPEQQDTSKPAKVYSKGGNFC